LENNKVTFNQSINHVRTVIVDLSYNVEMSQVFQDRWRAFDPKPMPRMLFASHLDFRLSALACRSLPKAFGGMPWRFVLFSVSISSKDSKLMIGWDVLKLGFEFVTQWVISG
jgi:hypothetical protein